MKKTVSRVMALLLASMLTLTGCGGSQETGEENTTSGEAGDTEQKEEASSENEIKDLVIPMAVSRELETFNILYAQRQEDSENLTTWLMVCWKLIQKVNWFLQLQKSGVLKMAV